MRRTGVVAGAVVAGAGFGAAALGGEASTAAYDASAAMAAEGEGGGREWTPRRWVVSFEPALWAPGLGGDIGMPGGGSLVSVERLALDDPEATVFGELLFAADRWTFSVSGFGYGFDDRVRAEANFELGGVEFARGARVNAEFDFVSAQATASYRVGQKLLAGESRENGVALLVDVVGGARVFDVDAEFELVEGGERLSAGDTWVEPMIGAKFAFEILEDFTIDLQVGAGFQPLGDTTSLSFDVVVGFAWRFLDTAGVQIGYRFLYTDLESGDGADAFEFQGSLAGLYAGLALRY